MIHVADWTAIVGYTSEHGLIIAQRRDGARDFAVRPIQRIVGLTPVHPVIVSDETRSNFYVVATGYQHGQPGRLIYATTSITP